MATRVDLSPQTMQIYANDDPKRRMSRSYGILIDALAFHLKYSHWTSANNYYLVPCGDIREWLAKEMPRRFDVKDMWITFDNKEDAITFKMRWG